jgi:hypothetical protein
MMMHVEMVSSLRQSSQGILNKPMRPQDLREAEAVRGANVEHACRAE